MAISKRLRFEILRRDEHCCRYCGEHASPDVKLTVDHVLPVALGGTDDPANLVAACGPCNSGKSASSPDAPLVAQVADDEIRWRRAIAVAASNRMRHFEDMDRYTRQFLDAWEEYDEKLVLLPSDFELMVNQWYSLGVPIEMMTRAVHIAMCRRIPGARVYRYMIGVMRNFIADMQRDAVAEMRREG